MKTEALKERALQQCLDIYNDFERNEVERFCPPSVQQAWDIGAEYVQMVRDENKRRMKDSLL